MTYCVKCGAPLDPGAQFCSKCGTAVAAPPPPAPSVVAPPPPPPATPHPTVVPPPAARPATPPPSRRSTWWIVPLVIVGLVLVAWLLLAGLPFGREERRVETRPAVDTVEEGTPGATPAPTGTIIDISDTAFQTETIAPPQTQTAATATTPPAQATQTVPPPVIVDERPPASTPRQPSRTVPPPAQPQPTQPQPTQPRPTPQPAAEISEGEASGTLRGFITSNDYYDGVRDDCVSVRGLGYQNVGYTFAVWDSCVEGGGSRMLGRWRVDAKTREVFRQRDDGRYLKP
jgi:hypothetical protein